MQCPKCKHSLGEVTLAPGLVAPHCDECDGHWLRGYEYAQWQRSQPKAIAALERLAILDQETWTPAPQDTKAALCPECGRYLSRVRVGWLSSFYLDRCTDCEGIWCDGGEWALLGKLNYQSSLDQLCQPEWQNRAQMVQKRHSEEQELQEKLGESLAQQVITLTQTLAQHPDGPAAIAYLVHYANAPE